MWQRCRCVCRVSDSVTRHTEIIRLVKRQLGEEEMFALRQIIEDPQDVIAVPVEFRHRPIEIIFMALESNAPDLLAQNGMTATSKILRANWFEGYNVEEDVDVLASLPIDEGLKEWEW